MTMTFHVHAVEQDLASKWYARVVISEDESVFLKFDDFPTMEQIQQAAAEFIKTYQPAVTSETDVYLVRARDETGRFIADNPLTPENEAWVEVSNGTAE